MKADLQVISYAFTMPRRIPAAATRFYAGEPLHSTATISSGADTGGTGANVWVVAAADTPVIATHRFGGIAMKGPSPLPTGTVVACEVNAACPIPYAGRIRGKAETALSVDTDAELLGILRDVTLIDYNATGGAGSTPLYTIKEVASADTSGLEIVDGNVATQTLDVAVDARAYRHDVS